MPVDYTAKPVCTICERAQLSPDGWYLFVLGCMGGEIHIVEWDRALVHISDGCACGEACAHKGLSRWFETRSLEAAAVQVLQAPLFKGVLTQGGN
jgi:hypothetical protein